VAPLAKLEAATIAAKRLVAGCMGFADRAKGTGTHEGVPMHPTKEKLEFGRKKSAGFLKGGRMVRL